MNRVYKYHLPVEDRSDVRLPMGAEILHVGVQGGEAFIWSRVDPDAPQVIRTFAIHGTGHDFQDDDRDHIGTFMLSGGALVFHVFELNP